MMQAIQQIPQVPIHIRRHWRQYLVDSLLAGGGALICTLLIYVFHLYPTIPNISIVYLLLILVLACTRGRYATILAALVAVFSFDYLLVPPIYSFTIFRWEEWLALIAFMVMALLTSQLASRMRHSTQEAWRREREARILYEASQVINSTDQLSEQLDSIALALVRVFAPWGVQECALLLLDQKGNLTIQAEAPIRIEHFTLSPEEMAHARRLMEQQNTHENNRQVSASGVREDNLRLIPLRTSTQILGILCLRLEHGISWLPTEQQRVPRQPTEQQATFFWTFLEQAVLVIERARFRSQALSQNE
jgi:two-component system sensor histidine kinase KdpD